MTKKQIEINALSLFNQNKDSLVDAVLDSIRIALEEQEGALILKNFGTFKVKLRAEKKCRNMQTGEAVIVPAHNVVVFKPSKNFFIGYENMPKE